MTTMKRTDKTVPVRIQNTTVTLENSMPVPYETGQTSFHPTIPFLDIYMRVVKNMFIRARNWKQPKCLLTGERINKLQCI